MMLNQFVVIVWDWRIPIELALVVRIEDAIVETRMYAVLFAGCHKRSEHIRFVPTRRDIVVVTFRIPEAESGHVLCGQNRIARSKVARNTDPLPHVQISGIVPARGNTASLVIVPREGVHAEVEGNAKLHLFKAGQYAS